MAISVKGKLKKMINNGKADPNVQVEYDELEEKYKISKQKYRNAREDLKETEERLQEAKAIQKDTPLMQRKNINRRVRLLKAKVEAKQQKYDRAKESYKSRLKAFRTLKRIIRQQVRACKVYEDFFEAEAEARKLGITIPRYIRIEIQKHQQAYRRARFSIDKRGINEIEMPDIEYASDLRSLIREKKAEVRREKVERLVENTKNAVDKIVPGER